jgi:hypothetical protein
MAAFKFFMGIGLFIHSFVIHSVVLSGIQCKFQNQTSKLGSVLIFTGKFQITDCTSGFFTLLIIVLTSAHTQMT